MELIGTDILSGKRIDCYIDNSYIIGKGSTDFPLGYILIDKIMK